VRIKGGAALAELAMATEDVSERSIGWLRRTDLAPGEGLLIGPASAIHTLGMKVSIDVVFMDRDYVVTKVYLSLPPHRFAWGSWSNLLKPWRSQVLELPPGVAKQLRPGDALEVSERTETTHASP
jgi:uncharacterized membrane protein (UPF0127 family)